MKGYYPQNWMLGRVAEILEGKARVHVRLPSGRLQTERAYYITPCSQRAIIVGVDGLFFSDRPIGSEPGEVQIGALVIFEPREKRDNVYGWTTRENYRQALDVYDMKYSPRVMNPVRRCLHRPDEIRIPDRPYLDSVPAPTVEFGVMPSSVSQTLSRVSAVRYYPDDPDFEGSLTLEDLQRVQGMSAYARKKFRTRKLTQEVVA